MALQEDPDPNRAGPHHCRDCELTFESGKSLEVHFQYHKENLLSKWATQAANQASHNAGDTENNNVRRRELQTAPADSTVLPTGPGRPSSTTGYTNSVSPYPHPQTPSSYTSVPSPYQNDVPSNPGPSPSSTSYGYSNGEGYSIPYNGYVRTQRQQGFFPEQQPPQENYSIAPVQDATPHSPTSSSGFRFFNKSCYPLDKNGVSSSSPNTCEKCGCICESQIALSDHIKSAHPYAHVSAFQAPDSFYKSEPTHGSPDLLDLDCQQKFRPPEDESVSLPPVSNPHSVSAMLGSWAPQTKYPPYHVTSSNPQSFQNGVSYPPESYPPTNVPNSPANANATSPKPAPQNSGKGDSWKSNEARRPKTYNCSACNKWFTSSGHLKRHYNTTLHKNAVKQSGHPDPATLPISSHHHPDRDPNYIHSSKTPPGMANPPPNMGSSSKPKKAKSMSPQRSMEAISPALSSANEGDSSRSGFSTYDLQQQPAPPPPQPVYDNGFAPSLEPFEYYRHDNRLQHNSTNQATAQPPNYQAGLSVSPSGDLPICPPLLRSLPTLNHMTTYTMGENITTQVESVQQLPVLGHIMPQYTHIITGNQSEPLPSFSQLLPESSIGKGFYVPTNACQEFYMKTNDVNGGHILTFKVEPTDESFIKTEPQDLLGSYEDMDSMLSETSPDASPIELPTSTNVEPDSQGVKPTKKKKKRKDESSNHVSSTGSPKPAIRCEECDKSFNRICYLTQHNKCFHSGAKPFKCERCGKRFHSENRALDHERKHGGVKPYRCEICPKSFNHKTDLRRHQCLHSGNKPFACETCGKGFIRKDHMLKHMDTHKNTRKRYIPPDYSEEDEKARPRLLVHTELK